MGIGNIAETVLKVNDETVVGFQISAETVLENSIDDKKNKRVILNQGQIIAKKYVVMHQINNNGNQASVYLAKCDDRQCVIKIYDSKYKPLENLMKNLKGHNCPYVTKLLGYGYEKGAYYEIYDFYGKGTLEEKGKCTLEFIKDIVVPDLNEGLHFLHTFGENGVIHGDIKPSNIFVSNNETNVIIGDFGISLYLDEKGKVLDEIRGTPEYAPRTVSFFGKATKTPAYDYGSLGLVLIKLATGHSLFKGLNITSINQMWEEGIRIPDNIDGRLKRLICGLLVEDEQRRFGYEEVKKWCEGEFIHIKSNSIYSKDDFEDDLSGPTPFVFGIFGDKIVSVSSLYELSTAIAENWNHTKKLLKRDSFYEFVSRFDKEIEKKLREYGEWSDEDKAVFFTLYEVRPNQELIYKGINYGNARTFINGLNSEITSDVQEIFHKGLFEFYLEVNGCETSLINQIHRIIQMENDMMEFVVQLLQILLNVQKGYEFNGKMIYTIDELISEVVDMRLSNIEKLASDTRLMAWLYDIGYGEDVLRWCEL